MEGFTEFYEDSKGLVISFINKNTYRTLSPEEKEELQQACLIGLWIAKERYDPSKGAFSTIAYKIMQNEATSYLRSNHYFTGKRSSLYSDKPSSIECLGDTFTLPYNPKIEQHITDKVFIEGLFSKVKLRVVEKEIIKWFYMEDKPISEYAELKGLDLRFCINARRVGIDKIRKYIKKEGLRNV